MAGTPSAEHPRAFIRAAAGGRDHDRAVAALGRGDRRERTRRVAHLRRRWWVRASRPRRGPSGCAGSGGKRRWRMPRVLAVIRPSTATLASFAAFTGPADHLRADAADVGSLAADDLVAVAVPTAPVAQARERALGAHGTQVELLPGGVRAVQPDRAAAARTPSTSGCWSVSHRPGRRTAHRPATSSRGSGDHGPDRRGRRPRRAGELARGGRRDDHRSRQLDLGRQACRCMVGRRAVDQRLWERSSTGCWWP